MPVVFEQDGTISRVPSAQREPPLLPEDVRSFIFRVTLHLQSNRSKTPAQHDAMFQEAYRLYARYDVEGWRKEHHGA